MTAAGYEAALEGAAFFARPDVGYLRVSGEDRFDYLHRQTTNDVNLLRPERAVLSVLTSPAARILDVLLLLEEGGTIGLITLPGRGPATAAYFHSRIFFMDRVSVSDASADLTQYELDGPQAEATLRGVGLEMTPGLDEVVSFDLDSEQVRVIGCEGLVGAGYLLLAPSAASEALATALTGAGAVPLEAESRTALRVEAGLPGPFELSEDYTPLETNLHRAISDTKGCYTGQEVIARQIAYGKVTRQMVGLRLNAPTAAGAQVMAEGRLVGAVTSAALSPLYGPIALAIIKRPHHQPGAALTVVGEDGELSAEVMALPFRP